MVKCLVQDISNVDPVYDLDCATDEMVLSIDNGGNQAQMRYFSDSCSVFACTNKSGSGLR